MAIQVVNAVSNVAWTTDKVEIATSAANVTFQVSVVQLTYCKNVLVAPRLVSLASVWVADLR